MKKIIVLVICALFFITNSVYCDIVFIGKRQLIGTGVDGNGNPITIFRCRGKKEICLVIRTTSTPGTQLMRVKVEDENGVTVYSNPDEVNVELP